MMDEGSRLRIEQEQFVSADSATEIGRSAEYLQNSCSLRDLYNLHERRNEVKAVKWRDIKPRRVSGSLISSRG